MIFAVYTPNLFSEGGVKNCLKIFLPKLHSRTDPPPQKEVRRIDCEKRQHVGRALSRGCVRPFVQTANGHALSANDPSRCGAK